MQFYVNDIMSTDVYTVQEDMSVRDLIKTFADKDVLGLPVIDKEGYIAGVVSSTDVLKQESSHTFYHDPFIKDFEPSLFEDTKFFDKKVKDIMTNALYTIEPDATIAKMAKTMYEKKIHRLLVVEYNKLIGIVSTFDVLKLLATSDEEIILE